MLVSKRFPEVYDIDPDGSIKFFNKVSKEWGEYEPLTYMSKPHLRIGKQYIRYTKLMAYLFIDDRLDIYDNQTDPLVVLAEEKFPISVEEIEVVHFTEAQMRLDGIRRVWKPINDSKFTNCNYWVSELGEIASPAFRYGNYLLKQKLDGVDVHKPHVKPYKIVFLRDNENKSKITTVHRMIAKTFLIKPVSKSRIVVDHIDGNKENNHISNLEYVTSGENNRRAYALGLNKQNKNGWGANNRPVIALHVESGEVKEFGGVRVAERELGLPSTSVKDVCKGRSSHSKGWFMMYKEDHERDGWPTKIKIVPRYNKKEVQQLNKETGEVIAVFSSAREAMKETGTNFTKISAVCSGDRQSAGGFHWKMVSH